MILQEQECVFLCVEGGVNEGEAMLEVPPLLPAVRPSWAFIPWPLQSPHPDSWILLPPSGDFQYGTVAPGGFIQALVHHKPMSRIPKMWFAGREILGTVHKEQLGSNFKSRSCTGKLREL